MGRTMLRGGLALGVILVPAMQASALEPVRPELRQAAKACPRHGAGFVQIPGSTTCIRIGGRARAGLDLASGRDEPRGGPIAAGRLAVDTRTESDYGPVRTYVRIDAGRR